MPVLNKLLDDRLASALRSAHFPRRFPFVAALRRIPGVVPAMNVEAFAASQYGVVSRAQAVARGMSESAIDRRLKAGRWVVVFPGVYRVVGAPVTARQRSWQRRCGAAVSSRTTPRLACCASKRSEAGLHLTVATGGHAIEDVHAHRTTCCPTSTSGLWTHSVYIGDSDVDRSCSAARRRSARSRVRVGRRMGLTTVTLLARRANELCGKGRPGSGRVRRLLAVAETRATESRLEVKFARLLRASALPKPVRQYPVGAYRLDFAWPWLWVAAECDGFERHGTRLAWKRDRARIAAIEHDGLAHRPLHVGRHHQRADAQRRTRRARAIRCRVA